MGSDGLFDSLTPKANRLRNLERLIAALPLVLLSACVDETSSFVVPEAGSGDPLVLQELSERITAGRIDELEYDEIVRAHRIEHGRGTVFAHRAYRNDIFTTDSTYGFKITIFLTQPLPESPTKAIISRGKGGNEALASDWSSWGGCLAYVSDGEIQISTVTDTHVTAHVRLNLDWIRIDAEYTSACGRDRIFEETLLFERKQVSDLTPWEGRSDKATVQSEEWWPKD